ncbi:MAG: L,D-transpeptidase family protein [Gemmatimonadota bacterium]
MIRLRTSRIGVVAVFGLAAALTTCGRDEPEIPAEAADVFWSDDTLTAADIEAGRRDSTWRKAVRLDRRTTVVKALDTVPIPEAFDDLGRAAEEARVVDLPGPASVQLPLFGDVEGPSVLFAQILLDRVRFSPGVLDGKWGKNTEKAVYWFQHREDLPASGIVDSITFTRLHARADAPEAFLREHLLTEKDVAGPFVDIPADVYAQRRLDCMCFESLAEKLGERFHATPAVLAALNPGVSLDSLRVGDSLLVPDLGIVESRSGTSPLDSIGATPASSEPGIGHVLVSGLGSYLHVLDEEGRILYHFPTTLGSSYDPSPEGEVEVVSVTPDPWFHYQPSLLGGVDRSKPSTLIPPGPNNPVGRVWIKLSKPHYGIHGTREPATIGYETSSGCVRLTNWDAMFLGARLGPGVTVEFRATRAALQGPDSLPAAPLQDDGG